MKCNKAMPDSLRYQFLKKAAQPGVACRAGRPGQAKTGDWQSVMQEISCALKERLAQ